MNHFADFIFFRFNPVASLQLHDVPD
jgi:hypothetical protein